MQGFLKMGGNHTYQDTTLGLRLWFVLLTAGAGGRLSLVLAHDHEAVYLFWYFLSLGFQHNIQRLT